MEQKNYYNVALSLSPIWKSNEFTYEYVGELEVGDVVLAPFGKSTMLGFVTSKTTKPEIKTKSLEKTEGFRLQPETLKLYEWLCNQYPNLPGAHAQSILPSFLKNNQPKRKPKTEQGKRIEQPPLTKTQKSAIKEILTNPTQINVLQGITGSGKTRVYIELINRSLAKKKNALLTYPEIALTPQLEKALSEAFGKDRIQIFHSKLTRTKQYSSWIKVLGTTGGAVTIGPRSSLFLPHDNLDLIIIDEAHDSSYKQDSGSKYNGLHVAAALAKIHKAKLIFGSATPPIQETAQIIDKGGSIVRMHELAITSPHKEKDFRVIDMTRKENISSDSYLISKQLAEEMKANLNNKKQTLLFLNRRGTAHALLCDNCGWHAECPRCDMPLTYHHDSHKTVCHLCGYSAKSPSVCPDCGNDIKQRSLGTKAIENDLKQMLPQAKVARFDSDNKKSDSLAENFASVVDGEVDIIIGTQIVTKGLDLPKLQTVGVLQADNQLFMPDFSSEERAFQQLTQVSGRVGRGHSQGSVILQTYQPDNDLFEYVQRQDWHGFYEQQLQKRKLLSYPPYSHLLKLTTSRPSDTKAKQALSKIIEQDDTPGLRFYGPAPGFYAKRAGQHNWQLVVKSQSRGLLSQLVQKLPRDIHYDLDPINLL